MDSIFHRIAILQIANGIDRRYSCVRVSTNKLGVGSLSAKD